jgi:16S rRNA (cytosine967-C5)-methyltransferase
LARDALVRVEAGAYSHVLVPELLRDSDLSARDRAFVTDLVYGTLRARRRLDALLEPHGRRPLEQLDPPVRAALRLGAYQLAEGVAVHAAVGETVEAAPERARGYVNAVLRAVAGTGPPFVEPENLAVALSYPDWLVDRLTADLGTTNAVEALRASNEPAAVTLRPNRLRTTPEQLADELERGGADLARGALVRDALVVRRTGDPARLSAVSEGRATPQDQASQAVVTCLAPEPGDCVLDVAAAPGGKSTAAGELMGDQGVVVALDVHRGRLRLVREAASRLGLSWVATMVADARSLPVAPASIDRALVDAPCSGLGVLRRRPEARWRMDPRQIADLADLQVALTLAAAATVRSGGRLVYSVCTLTGAETTGVAARVLDQLPGFTALPPPTGWRAHGPGALVLPQDAGTDGMYVLRLRRRAGNGH